MYLGRFDLLSSSRYRGEGAPQTAPAPFGVPGGGGGGGRLPQTAVQAVWGTLPGGVGGEVTPNGLPGALPEGGRVGGGG